MYPYSYIFWVEDVCELRLTRRYAARAAEVWEALLARTWLGAIDATLVEVEPGRVLEVTLVDSVARIELSEDAGTTTLVLEHRAIPAERGMTAMRVWTLALARLEEAL